MKIWLLSDLHVDIEPIELRMPTSEPDVLVVAGDVRGGLASAIRWLRKATDLPTVFVPGNGDFHGHDIAVERRLGAQTSAEHGLRLLDEDAVVLNGVRFLGTTLWTDYALHGNPEVAMAQAACVNDFQLIKQGFATFTPQDAASAHRRARHWLEGMLSLPFVGPTVVVTHHAPHSASLSQRFAGHPCNPAFASDLGDLIARYQPDLWVHGHVHASNHYSIGRTRVISNPRGIGDDNPRFDPTMVIELAR